MNRMGFLNQPQLCRHIEITQPAQTNYESGTG